METFDLLIRNARLRNGALQDIGILGDRIEAIHGTLPHEAAETVDAGGMLVTESFCNPHLHLDKVFTLSRLDDGAMQAYHGEGMGKAMAAIESASRVKDDYRAETALENIRIALEMEILYDMVTVDAARAMGISGHRLAAGNPADLVVLDVPDVLEALRHHREPAHVIFKGKIVSGGG